MMFMPCTVISRRTFFGRFISMTKGASMPGPTVILPDMRMDFTDFSFSTPPRAFRFLAMISSTVWAAAGRARKARARPSSVLRSMEDLLFGLEEWLAEARILGDTGRYTEGARTGFLPGSWPRGPVQGQPAGHHLGAVCAPVPVVGQV